MLFSSLYQWLLTAIVKETIFKVIFVVISPLISLMQNQQKYTLRCKSVGLAAEFIEKDQSDKGTKWEHDYMYVKLSRLQEREFQKLSLATH